MTTPEAPKEFTRPVRQTYRHGNCGQLTTMDLARAEAHARDPKCYGTAYCAYCRTHSPLSEFAWEDGQVVGS